jgi:hypothetical protein
MDQLNRARDVWVLQGSDPRAVDLGKADAESLRK